MLGDRTENSEIGKNCTSPTLIRNSRESRRKEIKNTTIPKDVSLLIERVLQTVSTLDEKNPSQGTPSEFQSGGGRPRAHRSMNSNGLRFVSNSTWTLEDFGENPQDSE